MRYQQPIQRTLERLCAHGYPAIASEVPGVSSRQWRAAIDTGHVLRLRRGVVVPSDVWSNALPEQRHLLALTAALLAYPGSWASHTSALRLQGVHTLAPPDLDGIPHVQISRHGVFRREPGLTVHNIDLEPSTIVTVNGLRTVPLVRASIEVAARRPIAPATAVIDAAMRRSLEVRSPTNPRSTARSLLERGRLFSEWDEEVAPFGGHRWVTTVRQAIRWADPAAESYLESISRIAMREAALPMPQVGFPMMGDDGRQYWLDFWWEQFKVIGEADGLAKYAARERLLEEKLRQEALGGNGSFVRWGLPQVQPDPRPMIRRIRLAFPSSVSANLTPTRMEWVDLGEEAA